MSSRLGGGGGGGSTTDASLLTAGTLPLARLSGITTAQLDAAAGITSAQIAALDAAKITTGTLPLARLSGITTSQLSASAALVAGQIASVNPSALTGSGTVPLAGLSGITTTQLSASAALVAGQIASVNPSALTGSGTVPLAGLSGITTTQLDAAAAITSAQIAALDAAKITSGTLPLARLSGITTSQLAAGAAITSGQIASVAASTITGTNTLPDGVLSTNVPLLNANNVFTCAGSSASSGTALIHQITPTIAQSGTAGYTALLVNVTFTSGGSGARLLQDLQVGNSSKYKVDSTGSLTTATGATMRCPSYLPQAFQAAMTIGDGGAIAVSGQDTHTPNAAGNVPLICKGVASQTGDLFQVQNSAAAVQFGIMNGGSGGSPIWALRVRATANAESMAVSHTAGAATGKCIQVFDDAGTSLGYIALYA